MDRSGGASLKKKVQKSYIKKSKNNSKVARQAWKALTKPKTAKRQEQRALEKTQPSKIKVEEGEEAGPDAGLEPRVVTDFRATSASRARAQ